MTEKKTSQKMIRDEKMKKNQIKVKRVQNGTQTLFTIKNDKVYDAFGKNPVYCSCTGNTVETATPMRWDGEKVYCPNCHEHKVEVIQTYDEWKKEQDEKDRKRNEERLANLHLVEMGSDWECGFKFYGLSANIDYDDWLKVKKHFKYYNKGWSRGQELEWNYGEPSGWLTRNPQAVEEILVKEGLIKPENTMDAIQERAEIEKQERKAEREEAITKRNEIKEQMNVIDEKIKEAFNSEKTRTLTDAEARSTHFNSTYFRNTIRSFTIKDGEIIKTNHMVDFIYGVAIPYSKEIEELIKELHKLNEEAWDYAK